jgi:hypothetical protein
VRRLPGPAGDGLSDGGNSRGSRRFVSGLAENTNSIFCADSSESQTANRCPVLQRAGTTSREATLRNGGYLIKLIARSPERAQKILCFSFDKDLHRCPSLAHNRENGGRISAIRPYQPSLNGHSQLKPRHDPITVLALPDSRRDTATRCLPDGHATVNCGIENLIGVRRKLVPH